MTLPERRKMKSTNRQSHLRLGQTKIYLKMCLISCILISLATFTHCLPPPLGAQSSQMTLSSAIEEYPKFHGTLLNPAVVPFINKCKMDTELESKEKILCGSYFEMIQKLDASKVNGLTTLEDFNKAMSVYNQTKIQDFCAKFPTYIPKDKQQYPESYQLYKYSYTICPKFCVNDTDLDNIFVQPICRVFAIGFQLSEQPSVSVKNSVINQKPAKVNQTSESLVPGMTTKSEITSESVPKGQPLVAAAAAAAMVVPNNVNAVEKETINENVPIAESGAEGSLQKIENGKSNAKAIVPTNLVKVNQTLTDKPESKPTEKISDQSENPIPNIQTAEKPVVNVDQSFLDLNPGNDDEDVVKDDDDKTILKGVTDDNDNFDDSEINSKDKLINMNGDDSNENLDDEMLDSRVQPAKSSPEQSPSNEQLHNDEDPFTDDTDSNFFTYFMFLLLVCVIAYVVYHNKSKMLALMLEGRRSSTNGRSNLSRRKHTAAYRKLDSNLEEAITSSGNGRSTQVIY